jgi:hypothetical protein
MLATCLTQRDTITWCLQVCRQAGISYVGGGGISHLHFLGIVHVAGNMACRSGMEDELFFCLKYAPNGLAIIRALAIKLRH